MAFTEIELADGLAVLVEQADANVTARLCGEFEWTDVFVTHSGAEHSAESKQRKYERDLRILYKDVAERPGHPFVLFNLGMTYNDMQPHAEAVEWLERCVGLAVLKIKLLEPLYTWLADLPVVPWTNFNNTVVMGSFLLGLILFYPTYRVSKKLVETYRPFVVEKLSQYKIYKWLHGAELAARWKI